MSDSVVKWLESPEGEHWSRGINQPPFMGSLLVILKIDDPQDPDYDFPPVIWHAAY